MSASARPRRGPASRPGHRNSPEDVERLVTENLYFATYIAKRWFGTYPNDTEDLIGVARVGLVLAAERYDPERRDPKTGKRIKFITYAVFWIYQQINQWIHANDGIARVPGKAWDKGIRSPGSISLEDKISEDFTVADKLGEESKEIAAFERENNTRVMLGRAMAALPRRHRTVLALRFGLGGEEPMTLKAIGERMGCSRERIRQIEMRALAAARKSAGNPEMARRLREADRARQDSRRRRKRCIAAGRTYSKNVKRPGRWTAVREALRAAILEGLGDREAARRVGCSPITAARWRKTFPAQPCACGRPATHRALCMARIARRHVAA